LLVNRLPAVSLLAVVAACGGATQSPAAPYLQHADFAASASLPQDPIATPAPVSPVAASDAVVEGESFSPARAAPRWSWLFAQYFAAGTEGACGRSRACHAADIMDASSAYEWLERHGYIAGVQSPLVSTSNSCLRWFGGNMPPRGMPNSQAAQDLTAWVAAGAPND
jgi:hypothetical protein